MKDVVIKRLVAWQICLTIVFLGTLCVVLSTMDRSTTSITMPAAIFTTAIVIIGILVSCSTATVAEVAAIVVAITAIIVAVAIKFLPILSTATTITVAFVTIAVAIFAVIKEQSIHTRSILLVYAAQFIVTLAFMLILLLTWPC